MKKTMILSLMSLSIVSTIHAMEQQAPASPRGRKNTAEFGWMVAESPGIVKDEIQQELYDLKTRFSNTTQQPVSRQKLNVLEDIANELYDLHAESQQVSMRLVQAISATQRQVATAIAATREAVSAHVRRRLF